MSRHASLAEQLAPILAYSNLEQSATSNLSDGYNAEDIADLHEERRISIRPTLAEIMQSVITGPVVRNDKNQIVRIGKLRFSDGTQMERGTKLGIDGKTIEDNIRMPTGALLGSKDVQERVLGATGSNGGESNAYFCTAFSVAARAYIPSGKMRRGESLTRLQALELLAELPAYTGRVTYCPDGMAMGTAQIADNFIGMRMQPKASGGSISWADLSDKIAEREEYLAIERKLKDDAKDVSKALEAKTLKQFGQSVGYSKGYSRKGGKQRLLELAEKLKGVMG